MIPSTNPPSGENYDRITRLGLTHQPDADMDANAAHLARLLRTPLAGINLPNHPWAHYVGLYCNEPTSPIQLGRQLPYQDGYCRFVIARRRTLPIQDVAHHAPYAIDRVVERHGIRAYIGAPLFDPTDHNDRHAILGTVWAMDTAPHPWTRDDVANLKAFSLALLNNRIQHTQTPPPTRHQPDD